MKWLPAIFVVTVLMTATVGMIFNPAQADTLVWSWEAPTTRADDTPFDMMTEGAGYQIMFNGVLELNSDGTPLLLSPGAHGIEKTFPAGDVCIQLATQDNEGRLSAFTDAVNNETQTACKEVKAEPGQATSITVKIKVGE
jgi:hypothetical protein